MQRSKETTNRKRKNEEVTSENYNSSNIIPSGPKGGDKKNYGGLSAKTFHEKYNPLTKTLEESLDKELKTIPKGSSQPTESAPATHKRRKFEEEKDKPPRLALASRPLRSGELV